MGDDKNNDQPKRRLPGGFILLLLGALLLFLFVQNFSSNKASRVSFSHQLEHLANLDLIHPQENKKTALNDNLVTFSGKFKEDLTEEAKARYRYLELLNQHHEFFSEKNRLATELGDLEKNVLSSAAIYVGLADVEIPKNGYVVVGPSYDTPDRKNRIILHDSSQEEQASLKGAQLALVQARKEMVDEPVAQFGSALLGLIHQMRSPALGIGVEEIKDQLSEAQKEVEQAQRSAKPAKARFAIYEKQFQIAQAILLDLGKIENGVRLIGLRAVRNYVEDVAVYTNVFSAIQTNDVRLDKARRSVANVIWFFNNKEVSTRTLEKQNPEDFKHWFQGAAAEWENFAANKGAIFKAPDQPRNLVLEKTFKSEEISPNYFSYLITILPVILIVMLLYFIFSRQMKGMGSTAMNFGKSPAKMLNKSLHKVTFKDVAGVEEATEELEEVVDFLKDPGKFTALGARIPKGVLLIGPPGTGKTLIAKAVAGEADRPFFSISGSDFVEMFVGVGASRIRDLFDQSKKQAPCIVFIDEIDAVGRHRGAGIGGGHDEREQTLNQLLVEMDGFDTNEGVIIMAATNRPDVLDKALLRPGRFDRRIMLDLPDIKGRFEILKVHARRIKLDPSVDLMAVARGTAGSSGADLMNTLNEAALTAARKGRSAVTQDDALEATDKVRYGKERRSLELDANEKKNTAYHESGHAIVGLCVEKSDPIEKVTIIPRGMSLGATHFLPEKNQVSFWKKEIKDRLAVLMGGCVAEEIFLGDVSSGAQMDITQATQLARSMVCKWGMSESLGKVAYEERTEERSYLLPGSSDRVYSEQTAKEIDNEVKKILDIAYSFAKEIINKKKAELQLMTDMLLEFETLDKEDVHAIIEGKWDIEKKRKKIEAIASSHKGLPPPPPPEEPQEQESKNSKKLRPRPAN